MIVIIHAFGLAMMSVDRFISVRNAGFATEQRGFTVSRAALLIALAWLCSIGLSLPLVVPTGVDIEGNSQRYLCTIHSKASPAYVWTTTAVGYVCPVGVVVAMFIATAASAAAHRRKLSSSQAYSSSTESATHITETGPTPAVGRHRRDPAATLTVEVNAAKYVACLFAAWCLFILPFPVLWLVRIGRTAFLSSRSQPFSYTRDADAVVTWLFVSYPVLLPVITCIWRRNVCCSCVHRTRTCCRESVSAAEASSNNQSPSVTPKRRQRVGGVHPFYISPGRPGGGFETSDRSVPVLFATARGLHIRSSSAPDPAPATDRQVEEVKSEDDARKCDVFGSVSALQNEDLINTSDYDSGDDDAVGAEAGQSGYRLDRSMESWGPPSRSSVEDTDRSTTPITAWRPRSEHANRVSCGIGGRPSGSSTWYDDENSESETTVRTRVDRLIDSGVGMTKKCSSSKTTEKTSGMTEDEEPESATTATPISMTEGIVKLKKKNEESRDSRRVADAEMSEGGRKDEKQKSTKTTTKTCESQNKSTEPSSMSTAAQPKHRDLPKIVINGKADEEDNAASENSGPAAGARQSVHSNTDPNIATAMAIVDVRSTAATGSSEAGGGNDEGAARNPGRPLPPLAKRRRAASESSARRQSHAL